MHTDFGNSKRSGLDRAVERIEKAIKTSQKKEELSESEQNLHNLLSQAQSILPKELGSSSASSSSQPRHFDHQETTTKQTTFQPAQPPYAPNPEQPRQSISEDRFALDDAENPLQLLARASDLADPSLQLPRLNLPDNIDRSLRSPEARKDKGLREFFGPFRPRFDIGEEVDPVDLGLVTLEEVDALFT